MGAFYKVFDMLPLDPIDVNVFADAAALLRRRARQYALPSASSMHKVVEALTDRGILVRDDDTVAFDSPFFLHWVRTEVAADLG